MYTNKDAMDNTRCWGCPDEPESIDTTKYKQVLLTKEESGNKALYICWIPNEFAVVGRSIRLSQNIHDIWIVREVYRHISTETLDPRKDGLYFM